MEKCLGIISGANIENDFGLLCVHRPVYMLPFGGRYRLIDFTISNMVNNGIKTIAVYTGDKIRSTMDHLGDGKPWDLNRRFNGLFIFPPVKSSYAINYHSDVTHFFSTLDFFEQSRENYIYINHPNIIAKVDLDRAFKFFRDTDADITIFYKKQNDPYGEYINCQQLNLDENGELKNIGLNLGTEKEFNMFLKMGFFKKEVFIKILKDAIETGDSVDFQDAVLLNKDKYKINGLEFKGHVENIKNLKSFYDANMNLLKKEYATELFFEGGNVLTKSKDEPSTLYTETANVKNSLIANGCVIEGTVENSIIFRGVNIGKGAVVKNSVIMQKSEIGDFAFVVNSILDKGARIEKNVRIAGSQLMPYVVEKNREIRKD